MFGFAFAPVVIASTVIDAFVAISILLVSKSNTAEINFRCVTRAVVGTTVVFAAKLPLLTITVGDLNAFGLIRLAYVDLVVAIPAVALILLVGSAARRWHLTLCTRVLAWAGLSGAGVGVYATYIEPFRLQVETVQLQLPAEREGFDVVRLAILSDLQTDRVTDYEQYAVSRLIALQPDAVFILGDVFQGSQGAFENQLPALRALLARLDAPSGVFLIPGNVDFPPERINRLAEGTRIQPLVNRIVRVTAGDRRLTIGGVEMDYRSPRARETIDQLESDGGRGDIRILLSHRPDVMLELRRSSRIDLVAAGHTHGGQVVIPGFGPPIISSRLPRVVGAGGLHEIDGRTIYVSRGVGHERGQAPRLRFFCPPAIDLITIPFRSRVPPSSGSPAVP